MLTYSLWCILSAELINQYIFKHFLKFEYYYSIKYKIDSNDISLLSETLHTHNTPGHPLSKLIQIIKNKN